MTEAQPTNRCSFMIGSEVIAISPSNKNNKSVENHEQSRHEGFLSLAAVGLQLSSADSAWLAEILFTRRRHLSEPVFSAGCQRRYSAVKRRLLRRSLPTIDEQGPPIYDDDDDEGCYDNMSTLSGSSSSDPTTPISLSAGSSPPSSDEDEFAQKWNKISSANSSHQNNHLSQNSSPFPSPCSSNQNHRGTYYELFGDESVETDENCLNSHLKNFMRAERDDGFFADDLSRRLEIEAAAKRKDQAQRYYAFHHNRQQTGVIGQVSQFV